MKLVALLLVAGSSLMAQRGGSGVSPTGFGRLSNPSGVPTSTAGGGFGRLIYPGTGGPPAVTRAGNGVGLGGGRIAAAPPSVGHSHTRTVIVPYPVYYGGYYYGYDAPPAAGVNGYGGPGGTGYDPGYAYDPNYASQQQSPVVIINQNFRPDTINPVVHDYSDVALPPAPDRPQGQGGQAAANDSAQIVFLIAMKDHTIFPAVAYWVEGDTLNYITLQGIHNRATLDLVDREFSQQLNTERKIDFALPPSK